MLFNWKDIEALWIANSVPYYQNPVLLDRGLGFDSASPEPSPCCLLKTLAVCFGSLSCWKINLLQSRRSFADWIRFVLLCRCIYFTLYLPRPLRASCWGASSQHDAATTMLLLAVHQTQRPVWWPDRIWFGLIKPKKPSSSWPWESPTCLWVNSSEDSDFLFAALP